MPRVPDWQAPQTRTGVLPMPDLHGASVPFQQGGLGDGLIKAGHAVQKLQRELEQQTDLPLLIDAQNRLKTELQRLAFDPLIGFRTLRGDAALRRPNGQSLEAEYLGKFDEKVREIEDALPLPRQKQAFAQKRESLREAFAGDLIQHTGVQFDVYQQDVYQGTIAVSQQDMALRSGDPQALAENRQQIRAATYLLGQRQGLSAQTIQALQIEKLSPGHQKAIEAQGQAGNLAGAAQYLADFQGEMTAKAAGFAQNVIGQAQRMAQAEALSQSLWQAGANATPEARYAHALTKAGLIEDGELRQQVKAQIKGFKEAEDAQQTALYEEAAKVVESGGFAALPPALRAALSSKQRKALWDLDDVLAKGKEPQTDYRRFDALMNMSSAELKKTLPSQERVHLNHSDYSRYMSLRQKAGSGDERGVRQDKAFELRLTETMKLAGIATGDNKDANQPKNLENQRQFRAAYQGRVDDFIAKNQREPNGDEQQSLLDSLLLEVVVPGSGTLPFGMGRLLPFGTGDYKKLWQVQPQESDKLILNDSDLTINDVPLSDRRWIIQTLRAQGEEASERAIVTEYANQLERLGIRLIDTPQAGGSADE